MTVTALAPRQIRRTNTLTVSVEVTLTGEARYHDALNLLDELRRVTSGLDAVSLDVTPGHGISDHSGLGWEVTPHAVPGKGIRILAASRRVLLDGAPVELTRIEYDLLAFLADNPQRVFTRPQLLQQVWGYAHAGQRTVDVHIRRIRAKLGDLPLVTTLRSVGYRLADNVDIRIVRTE